MCNELNVHLVLDTANTLRGPDVSDAILGTCTKLRDLAEDSAHGHRVARRVKHRDEGTLAGGSGPVHGRIRAVERPVGIDTPLVRLRRLANNRILVDSKNFPVCEDFKNILSYFGKLLARKLRRAFAELQRKFLRWFR